MRDVTSITRIVIYCFNFVEASEFACGGELCAHVRRSLIAYDCGMRESLTGTLKGNRKR